MSRKSVWPSKTSLARDRWCLDPTAYDEYRESPSRRGPNPKKALISQAPITGVSVF
jgi:hypothetical protein